MKDIRAKALRDNYTPTPFFFRQRSDQKQTRLVAWSANVPQMKELVYSVLRIFPQSIEVLLKVKKESKDENDIWARYHGKVNLDRFVKVMGSYESTVFQDGEVQLCVKRPDTGSYFVIDEDGLFFFYPYSEEIEKMCLKFKFEQRINELISEGGHWNFTPHEANVRRDKFITALGLIPTGGSQENRS